MTEETVEVRRVERVDDIPVVLATLKRLKLDEILDQHFPSCHRWRGELTFGEVVCVWLAFITSEGDHRLCALRPWAEARLRTLSACLGKSVDPLDFHDDRLADVLDRLAALPDEDDESDGPWEAFQVDLNRHTVRVYDLQPRLFRVDCTTANSYVEDIDALGYFQFGHSKDRDDLPQIKIALTTLDPLGMAVTTFVVPGNEADDPLYVPEIKKTQQAFGKGGKTYVTDCKGTALATRAYIASSNDFYLGPLSEKHLSADDRAGLLRPVFAGRQQLQQVHRPNENGEAGELVAEGFSIDVPLRASIEGKTVNWTERRWLLRSLAYAAGQHKQLDRRLSKATEQLGKLNERKQGKKRLTAGELAEAAGQIIFEQRVEGMIRWEVKTKTHKREVRAYRGKPARVEKEVEHRLEVWRCEEEVEAARREMGWRAYGTNDLGMNLAAVVWGYRGQDSLEGNFSRLKGRPLGLTPVYLQDENRVVGLVLLLSLALRLLSLLEWQVREKLRQEGKTIKGLYPGQPGRQAKSPTAELLLGAFTGVSLTILDVAGQLVTQVLPLTPLQQHLLLLWDLPFDLYLNLALPFSQPPPF